MADTVKYEPEWWESLLMLGASFGGWVLRAWVSMLAWRWFVVPLGAPSLGFWWMFTAGWALGGLLPLSVFRLNDPETKKAYYNKIAALVVSPVLVLCVLAVLRGLTA